MWNIQCPLAKCPISSFLMDRSSNLFGGSSSIPSTTFESSSPQQQSPISAQSSSLLKQQKQLLIDEYNENIGNRQKQEKTKKRQTEINNKFEQTISFNKNNNQKTYSNLDHCFFGEDLQKDWNKIVSIVGVQQEQPQTQQKQSSTIIERSIINNTNNNNNNNSSKIIYEQPIGTISEPQYIMNTRASHQATNSANNNNNHNKNEPMMTQYQLAYGLSNSQPNSLTNSYSSSNDVTDSTLMMSTSLTNNEINTSNNNNHNNKVNTSDEMKTEYTAKYRDFNEYLYVEGDGFVPKNDEKRLKQITKKITRKWISEVEERSQLASKFRARSKLTSSTLTPPKYDWDGIVRKKDRDLQALALATQLLIEEKRSEREKNEKIGSAIRSLSAKPALMRTNHSAPPSFHGDSALTSKPRPVRRPASVKSTNGVVASKASGKTDKMGENQTDSSVDKNNNSSVAKKPISKTIKKVTNGSTMATSSMPTTTTTVMTSTDGSKKIWIKPVKKLIKNPAPGSVAMNKSSTGENENTGGDVQKSIEKQQEEEHRFTAEPKAVPLRTTVIKSPEELTGIKSPSPESWKVTIEKGGLNWVNGGTMPVNFGDGDTGAALLLAQQQQQKESDGVGSGTKMVRPVPINAAISDDLYGPLSA